MIRMIRCEEAIVVEMHDRPCQTTEDYERVKQLLVQAGRQHPRLVVDCSQVEWIAGPFLSALLSAYQTLGARPGDIVLCSLAPVPRQVFEVTKLDRVFPICETRAEAMRAPGPEPRPIVVQKKKD
jgi:anti-anti-sigma factor